MFSFVFSSLIHWEREFVTKKIDWTLPDARILIHSCIINIIMGNALEVFKRNLCLSFNALRSWSRLCGLNTSHNYVRNVTANSADFFSNENNSAKWWSVTLWLFAQTLHHRVRMHHLRVVRKSKLRDDVTPWISRFHFKQLWHTKQQSEDNRSSHGSKEQNAGPKRKIIFTSDSGYLCAFQSKRKLRIQGDFRVTTAFVKVCNIPRIWGQLL